MSLGVLHSCQAHARYLKHPRGFYFGTQNRQTKDSRRVPVKIGKLNDRTHKSRDETKKGTKNNWPVYNETVRCCKREWEQMNERFKKVLVKKSEVNMNKIFWKKECILIAQRRK
jgi:hypothetical protein